MADQEKTSDQTEVIVLLNRIIAQVDGVEAKLDTNAQAMTTLAEKLNHLESSVAQLEADVRSGKRRTVIVSAISGATAGTLAMVGWEILKAKMGM